MQCIAAFIVQYYSIVLQYSIQHQKSSVSNWSLCSRDACIYLTNAFWVTAIAAECTGQYYYCYVFFTLKFLINAALSFFLIGFLKSYFVTLALKWHPELHFFFLIYTLTHKLRERKKKISFVKLTLFCLAVFSLTFLEVSHDRPPR